MGEKTTGLKRGGRGRTDVRAAVEVSKALKGEGENARRTSGVTAKRGELPHFECHAGEPGSTGRNGWLDRPRAGQQQGRQNNVVAEAVHRGSTLDGEGSESRKEMGGSGEA